MYSVPVRCSVSGVHSCMGTISRPAWSRQSSMVRPSFLSLGVAGSHLTLILNPWWSPVTRYRCLTSCKRQDYPTASARIKNCTIPSLVTQIVIPFVRVMSYLHNEIITHNAFNNTISVIHALNVVTNLGDYAHARDL